MANPSSPCEGQVIARSSRHAVVRMSGSNEQWRCELVGRLRLAGASNTVVVGDEVRVFPVEADQGRITEVLPRRNCLSRRREVGGGRELILAANIDGVLAVFSTRRPRLKFGALDRLLVAAESQGLPATIVINKSDLGAPDEVAERSAIYPTLGYPVLEVSAETGVGLDELAPLVNGRASVVAGPSGVGKSSLLNRLIPGLDLRVGEVSAHNEKGRHTTTRVTWHPLPGGGAVIDTPGFRDYALWNLPPAELGALMPDIATAAEGCHFSNCLHRTEPSCAVREAVDGGAIHPRRYESYLFILDSL